MLEEWRRLDDDIEEHKEMAETHLSSERLRSGDEEDVDGIINIFVYVIVAQMKLFPVARFIYDCMCFLHLMFTCH